jgi:hypothetical protein
MNSKLIKRIHRVSALVFLAAILFYLFFQVNKGSPWGEANPFANDPYDAVGSIAIQAALLISILSYARVTRWRDDPAQATKARLILRGNILVLAAIFITLCVDLIAELVQPITGSYWGNILRIELGGMFVLTFGCGLALWVVFRGIQAERPPSDLTPADAIDDLWSLVRVPIIKSEALFPPPMVAWIKAFNSDRLFRRIQWLDPRRHPWRFTSAVGLLVGLVLVLAQLQEGLPPSIWIGFIVTGIFISVEYTATLVGFAIFGGYLGLRPAFKEKVY